MAKSKNIEGKAPSQRQLRVAELIRRALSEILLRGDLHDPEIARASITVGEVRVSPDLRNATVFVLPLGGAEVDRVLEALERNTYEIRRSVTKNVLLKNSPNLRFLADKSYDQMDETRRLLSKEDVLRDLEKGDDTVNPNGAPE